jgi:hypothetical protein
MGLLNIAGGAAQGYLRGDQDIQRRREFEALQNQRKRVEQQQKLDDELTTKLKGVRPAGTYEDMVPQGHEAATDFEGPVGPQSGAKKVKTVRKLSDVAREQAGIMTGGGRLQDIQAAGVLNQQAYQADAADRAERDAKAREVIMQAGRLKAMGNLHASARALQKGYSEHIPDGHELQIEQGSDGSMWWGVTGPDGTWVEPPERITAESLEKRINQGIGMLSPELRFEQQKLGIAEHGAESQRISAEASRENAATALKKANFEIEKLGPAQIKLMEDQGYAARTRAEADKAVANMGRFGQVISGKDPNTGNAIYMAIDTRTAKPTRLDFGPDFVPDKAAQATQDVTPLQKIQLAAHYKRQEAGGYPSDAAADAALAKIINSGEDRMGQLRSGAPRVQAAPSWGAQVSPATANIIGGTPAPMVKRQPGQPAALPVLPRGIPWSPLAGRATRAASDTSARLWAFPVRRITPSVRGIVQKYCGACPRLRTRGRR